MVSVSCLDDFRFRNSSFLFRFLLFFSTTFVVPVSYVSREKVKEVYGWGWISGPCWPAPGRDPGTGAAWQGHPQWSSSLARMASGKSPSHHVELVVFNHFIWSMKMVWECFRHVLTAQQLKAQWHIDIQIDRLIDRSTYIHIYFKLKFSFMHSRGHFLVLKISSWTLLLFQLV